MGSSNWSDKTSIAPAPIGLTDEQKKEIVDYCHLPENEDVPYDLTAQHFTTKFGVAITGPEIFDLQVQKLAEVTKT
jgi:hypothetical protein